MATYKKRGYKKSKDTNISRVSQESLVAKGLEGADDIAIKSEKFLEKHQNKIYTAILIIALLVVGYYFYHQRVVIPKRMEAANEMNTAQQLFEKAMTETDPAQQKQLLEQALNGAGGKYGFLDIEEEYGSTPSGKLAHYYAGVSYYYLGEFDKAIEELSRYKAKDEILRPMALGLIGESFLQLNQPEDALEYFEKAANVTKNEFTTPFYWMKAGKTALYIYKNKGDKSYLDKAKKYFEKITDQYPGSQFAKEAGIYLAQAKYAG